MVTVRIGGTMEIILHNVVYYIGLAVAIGLIIFGILIVISMIGCMFLHC